MKNVLLVSSPVLHYRVSVYNFMSKRFRENGWCFKVLTNRLQSDNKRPLDFELDIMPFHFRRYAKYIEEAQVDAVILFIHLKSPVLWPLMHWLKLKGIPTVYWTKGGNLDRPDSRWRQWAFNYIFHLSDSLIMYSGEQLGRLTPANQKKAYIANNTINFDEIPSIPQSREEIKAEFDIPFRQCVLFVGTMGIGGERKRVEHLIQIFEDLERDDLGALIVGADMPTELQARIDPRKMRYFGAMRDRDDVGVSKLFKASDLFVVPGHVGLGLNQAFYWGLPVVTEHGKQPPEIHLLESGRNGYIVPENDVEALKNKMLYLLENDEVRRQFSEHAKEDVKAIASTEQMFEGFLRSVQRAVRLH